MNPAGITIIILIFSSIALITEVVPMAVTAVLTCMALALTGVLSPTAAFAQFSSTNIILYVATFIISESLFRTGFARTVGNTLTRFSKSEKVLVWAVAIISGLMSAFLSNLATTALLIPIIIGIANSTGYSRSRLLLAMGSAVATGGMATLLGGPGNVQTKAYIEEITGQTWGAFELSKVGVPLLIIVIIYFSVYGYWKTPNVMPENEDTVKELKQKKVADNIPVWHQYLSAAVFVGVVLGMIFENQIGVKFYMVAVIGALILVITKVVPEAEAYQCINWKTVFIFGGLLPLGTAVSESGAGDIIGSLVLKMMGNTTNPFVVTAILMLVPLVLTQFISNTTARAMTLPIAASVAAALKADPVAITLAVSFGSAIAIATPMGQPGNLLVFGASGLKLKDFLKIGLPCTIIEYAAAIFLLPIIWPFWP